MDACGWPVPLRRVLPCSKRFCHDWTVCPYSHPGEKAKRRDPRLYSYTGIACPDMKKVPPPFCAASPVFSCFPLFCMLSRCLKHLLEQCLPCLLRLFHACGVSIAPFVARFPTSLHAQQHKCSNECAAFTGCSMHAW
jgi:hypothetical protein